MATQRSTPKRTLAAKTAGCLLLACFSLPALANNPKVIPCPDVNDANLTIPEAELSAQSVNHEISIAALDEIAAHTFEDTIPPSQFLSPRAEDAIRAAFAGENDTIHVKQPKPLLAPLGNPATSVSPIAGVESEKLSKDEKTQSAPVGLSNGRKMHTVLPGVSDDEFSRYKKQMFRRDI